MPSYVDGSNGIITTGNVSATGNVTGNYILGNGALLTGIVTSNVDLGNISQNVIPSANVTYSLGNATHQWKDLWLSNNTLYINSLPLSTVEVGNVATIQFNGEPIVTSSNTAPPQTANIATTAAVVANEVVANSFAYANGAPFTGYTDADVSTYLASGNNTAGYSTTGNVTANFFIGDGSLITNLPAGNYSNVNVAAYLASNTDTTITTIFLDIGNTNSNVANLTTTVANTDANVANLTTSLANTNSNVANTNSNVANLTTSLANTNSNVANLTTALGNTDANVANLVTITTNTDSNVANLTTDLANTDSNVANLVTITTNTDSNVANLTTALANTDSNVSNLTLTVANLATTSSLANTNSNVANTNANVANLTLVTANNTSNIAQLTTAVAEGVTEVANTNANVANTNSNVANLQSQVNALPVINSIPSVYLTAVANGNGQTFSNVILGSYTSNTSLTAFLNGALLENTFYELAGDVLTINTYLNTGDNIDVITTLASNVNNVSSGYGNSNVALFFNNYAGNIVPATDNAYYLGEPGNVWATVYANTFVGDGSQLTGLPASYGNANVAAYLPTYTGNISAGNISVTGTTNIANANINNWTFVPQLWFVGKFTNLTIGTTQNADTLVSWNDVNDPQGWWVGGGTARVTPGIIGWYQVDYLINWTASGTAGTGQLNTQIRVNDVDVGFSQATNNELNGLTMMQSRMIYLANITDYITFTVYTTVSGQTMSGGISASQASVRWIST